MQGPDTSNVDERASSMFLRGQLDEHSQPRLPLSLQSLSVPTVLPDYVTATLFGVLFDQLIYVIPAA